MKKDNVLMLDPQKSNENESKWLSFIDSAESLLVLGSLNVQPLDRTITRSQLRPVQIIIDGKILPVSFFDSWGESGVSSIAFHPKDIWTLYVTTGKDLFKINLQTSEHIALNVPDLIDVHEITVINNLLWISNTGKDEIVAFDLIQEKIVKIVSLEQYRKKSVSDDFGQIRSENTREFKDKFHCNQIFEGPDGDIFILVHHINGIQQVKNIFGKSVKVQGDGGVINITRNRTTNLHLSAPHSVRAVGNHYWVLNSGKGTINIYDNNWQLKMVLPAAGWARGSALSDTYRRLYVGISSTRRRYRDLLTSVPKSFYNMVQIFSVDSKETLAQIELSHVEQINNVYIVPRSVGLLMCSINLLFC